MTLCADNALGGENLATLLALLAIGKTGGGAGCGIADNNIYLAMSALRITDITAHVTALVIFVCVCMGDDGVNTLLHKDFVTYRAMLTLGKTCLGAGGSYRHVGHLGVTCGVNSLLSNNNKLAYRAMLTLGKTALGAGGGYRLVDHLGVEVGGRNNLGLLLTAITVAHLCATLYAGGLVGYFPFAEAMYVLVVAIRLIVVAAGGEAEPERKEQRDEQNGRIFHTKISFKIKSFLLYHYFFICFYLSNIFCAMASHLSPLSEIHPMSVSQCSRSLGHTCTYSSTARS